jgi:hypothetical protein
MMGSYLIRFMGGGSLNDCRICEQAAGIVSFFYNNTYIYYV